MATKLIIDGYNFLWGSSVFRDKNVNFEKGREAIFQWMARHPQLQNFEVIVVFDAHQTSARVPTRTPYQGFEVIYTSSGQTADSLIQDLSAQYTSGAIVISSDNEVARYAEKKGCGVLGSSEFQKVIEHPEEFSFDPARKLPKGKRKAFAKILSSAV